MSAKTVIIIGGPTAVGKTSVAIALAQSLQTEIISADSRQCFRELNIGVARPAAEELSAVPHHFIATHSVTEKVTAATFEAYALEKTAALFDHKDVLVMVGGTGLYIKAFCEGFDAIPDVPESIREEIQRGYEVNGLSWLQTEIARQDPQFFASGEIHNPQRLMRALEVFRSTGLSIISFRKGEKAQRPFKTIKLALELPKEELHHNINKRVDTMIEQGLVEEVRSLVTYEKLNALQTVGYREIMEFFHQQMTLPDAVEAIKRNTRQYAKRQMTWFKKDPGYHWFAPAQLPEIYSFINQQLERS